MAVDGEIDSMVAVASRSVTSYVSSHAPFVAVTVTVPAVE